MSFILDALRKSEAARRRSEAPDLFASMPAAREPARARANWPLWLLGTVAAISLIAALWLLALRAPLPSPATPTAHAATETQRTDDITATAPVIAPAPESMPPTQAPADRLPPPIATATVMPPPAMSLPPPATSLPPPARELPAPPAEPAVVAPQTAVPPTGSAVSLADLDPATRKLLPPLKLSMHLWNETPAQRFVILDGQRLREGDLLGELVIERITRDGAVLVWRGGQLKIQLR